jgi:DNA-binding transcriptional MerR regulator
MMTSTTETNTKPTPTLPEKSHFKLDEVCSLTGVKPYVLRSWESEFEQIGPIVSSSGQKVYEHKDIEAILRIKSLVYEKKWTLEQVKLALMLCDKDNIDIQDHVPPLPQVKSKHVRELSGDQLKNLMSAKRSLLSLLTRTEQLKKTYSTL